MCVCIVDVCPYVCTRPTQQQGHTSISTQTSHPVDLTAPLLRPALSLFLSCRTQLIGVVKLTREWRSLLLWNPLPATDVKSALYMWEIYIESTPGFLFFRRGNWSDTPSFIWEVREIRLFPVSDRRVEVECRLEKVRAELRGTKRHKQL